MDASAEHTDPGHREVTEGFLPESTSTKRYELLAAAWASEDTFPPAAAGEVSDTLRLEDY